MGSAQSKTMLLIGDGMMILLALSGYHQKLVERSG